MRLLHAGGRVGHLGKPLEDFPLIMDHFVIVCILGT